jgi:hypothetical protein
VNCPQLLGRGRCGGHSGCLALSSLLQGPELDIWSLGASVSTLLQLPRGSGGHMGWVTWVGQVPTTREVGGNGRRRELGTWKRGGGLGSDCRPALSLFHCCFHFIDFFLDKGLTRLPRLK